MRYKWQKIAGSFITFFLFAGSVNTVTGQQYDFKIYSVNDGLPQAQVHDMEQTEDGFIWMATNGGGLSRFDGRTFKTYTTDDGLRNNAVQHLLEDSRGNFWVATLPGGVVTFEGDSLVNPFPEDSLSQYEVWQIEELKDNEIWFGTYKGGIFILKDDELSRLTTTDGLINNSIWDFWEDEDGTIWIATQNGVSVLKKGKEITNYTADDGLSGDKIYRIAEDHQGNKWFATSNGITVWDGEDFRAIREINGTTLGYVFDIKIASDNKVWIGTETKGVFVYDDEEYTHFTKKNGLSSNYIYSLFEDNDNNVWIATDENGVNIFRGDAFIFYNNDFGLSTDEVLSLDFDSEGTLWLGTTEGIESFDGDEIQKYPLPGEYENSYIWEIEELPNENLLFLMPDYTLMEYDGQRFNNFTSKKNLQKWFIYDLLVDSNDILWIATDEGLYRLEGEELQYLTTEDGMAGDVVQYVYEGKKGNLFIGTNSGLSIYDGSSFKNFDIDDGLAHTRINYITEDAKDNLWLGTDGGISLLRPQSKEHTYEITNFGKEDGLNMLSTHFIWFDEYGYLWQGTNGGLYRLNIPMYWQTGEMNVVHFALSDEGLGVEFNFQAIAEDSQSNAWFGSMDGILKLNPAKLKPGKSNKPPRVHFTNIKRNAESIDWNSYTAELNYKSGRPVFPSVTFPHGEHSYTFSFIGLDYRHPRNVKYRYKMEGFEDKWMPSTSANSATYTNLEPGDYTFVVQARAGESLWESSEASYSFSVAHPFWQTYWFYSVALISLLGLVYGYIKIRLEMLEKSRLQELVDEKTKDLQEALDEKEVLIKEIHHRVKNNLAVISGLLELQMGYADNNFANRILAESQRRIQSISMIHEKLYQNERLAEIDVEKYVRELVDIISYSFGNPNKEIDVEIEVDHFKLGVDQGIPCGLILNEVISNSFEHAFTDRKKGSICIQITNSRNRIILTVKDDGKGLPENFDKDDRESLGLTLVHSLCKQLEGKYSFENTEKGTKFTLEFVREKAPRKIPD